MKNKLKSISLMIVHGSMDLFLTIPYYNAMSAIKK